jgi:DNA-binding SARP family transcriptional activator
VSGTRVALADFVVVDAVEIETFGWRLLSDNSLSREVRWEPFFAELLSGWYDDWVIFERERRQQLHLRFAEALVYAHLANGRTAEALDLALHVVNVDHLRAGGQRALIAVYCAEGNMSQAQAQYERHRQEVDDNFHCAPSFVLLDVVNSIRGNSGGLPIGGRFSGNRD